MIYYLNCWSKKQNYRLRCHVRFIEILAIFCYSYAMLKRNPKNLLLLLLASLMLFMSVSAPVFGGFHSAPSAKGAVIETPCPQQKSAQAQASKLCQSYSQLQFVSAISLPVFDFLSLSEKIQLLFILGLLIMSPIYLIFKPPKPQFLV